MTAEPQPLTTLTFEEYLKFEDLSEERHEFVGGTVFVMSGGTEPHDLVAGAVYRRLFDAFRAKGCRTFVFNRKLKIGESVYYPDVFVTCAETTDRQYETDAAWVVEVLSESTQLNDRREKAAAYALLPSLRGYLIMDPDWEYVRMGQHGPEGWAWYQYGPRHTIDLDGVTLDLGDLFAEVREMRVSE
jgi:Uma2 family endonuclease